MHSSSLRTTPDYQHTTTSGNHLVNNSLPDKAPDAAGAPLTGAPPGPSVYAVGNEQWRTQAPAQPRLLGGGAEGIVTPGPPAALAVPAVANPTFLQQCINLPLPAKAGLGMATLGLLGLGAWVGASVASVAGGSHQAPTPAPCNINDNNCELAPWLPPPLDPINPWLYNVTQTAFARCLGEGNRPAGLSDYVEAVVRLGAEPLVETGVANVTQAVQQLTCPPAGHHDSPTVSLTIIAQSFLKQLGELMPAMPAPAPHTGGSTRVMADVVGGLALTIALHTLGVL